LDPSQPTAEANIHAKKVLMRKGKDIKLICIPNIILQTIQFKLMLRSVFVIINYAETIKSLS